MLTPNLDGVVFIKNGVGYFAGYDLLTILDGFLGLVVIADVLQHLCVCR